MSSSRSARYLEGSIFGHVSTLSLTSAIGLFALFIVDLVDVYFISLLGVPELAAAVGFAGAALFFGAAVGIGLAIATSTLVAQAIGEDPSGEQAQRLATHGLVYGLLWTIPVTILSLIYAPEFLSLIGAEGETLEMAVGYFRIVGASLPVLGIAMAATSLLRAVGEAQRSMWSTIIGGVVNAVLDPLFIFGLGLDLTGAATASVISRCTVAGIAVWFLMRDHGLIGRPQWAHFFSDARQLSGIALPSLATNLAGPVGAAYATSQMARFGADAVAASAVIGRLTPVAFAGLYGLSGAIGPVASQNFGAGNHTRVKQTLLAAAGFVAAYVLPVSVLIWFAQDALVSLFALEGEAADLLRFYSTFIVISYALFGLQLAANPLFTSLRHPGYATISNMVRDLGFGIPFVMFGSSVFGAPGVLAGQALGNALAGIMAFGVALWLARRVEAGKSIDLRFALPGKRLHYHRHVAPGVQHRG